MRPTSILLVLVVVLGFASEAGAWMQETHHDLTITIAGQQFGFYESKGFFNEHDWDYSWIHLGPLGHIESPFTATQGLVGFCVIVAGLVTLVTLLTVARWRTSPGGQA